MQRPDWFYDDTKQIGLNFADEAQVHSYDSRQADETMDDDGLLDSLKIEPTHVVADIGCGTGRLACAAAARAQNVVAVDISGPMLEETRRRAAALGLKNLEAIEGSFLNWASPRAPFDIIVTKFALHHLPDFWKAPALQRLHQALKPGGRLFLRDIVFSCSPDEINKTIENWIGWLEENTGYTRAEATVHVKSEHSTFGWIMEGLLANAGFRIMKAEYDSGRVYADYLLIKARQNGTAGSDTD